MISPKKKRAETPSAVQLCVFAPNFKHDGKSLLPPPLTKEMHPVPSRIEESRRAVLTCLQFPEVIEW